MLKVSVPRSLPCPAVLNGCQRGHRALAIKPQLPAWLQKGAKNMYLGFIEEFSIVGGWTLVYFQCKEMLMPRVISSVKVSNSLKRLRKSVGKKVIWRTDDITCIPSSFRTMPVFPFLKWFSMKVPQIGSWMTKIQTNRWYWILNEVRPAAPFCYPGSECLQICPAKQG